MTKRFIVPTAFLFLFVAMFTAPVQAQSVSQMWEFTPKAGAGAGVEEALRSHVEYRKSLNDPWSWQVYQEVVGPNVGKFYVASWSHSWADFDAYDSWAGGEAASAHFQATVAPLLEEMSNGISQEGAISRFPDDPNWQPSLVNVTVFYLIPGKQMAFDESIRKIHDAIEGADMPFYYSSDFLVAGGSGPVYSIAGLSDTWADFADPDPSMEQVMTEAYGEEEAMQIFTAFSESVHHWESFVVRYRPDLSLLQGM